MEEKRTLPLQSYGMVVRWFMVSGGGVNSFDFTVDRQLRVVAISRELEKTRANSSEPLLGLPYNQVLPLIFYEGAEAIRQVVLSGVPLTLKNYRFACWHQPLDADIDFTPILDNAGVAAGARVSVTLLEGCSLDARLKKSQHLIDIGMHAASLSHGVRNPLNAIKGAVVYLKNRYQHETTLLEFAAIMEEEISRLDRFITDFLSASLGDAEKETTDLNALLRRLELLTIMQAKAAGIEIQFQYGEVAQLQLSPFQVEQAILNVLNNALHALSSGGKITVESRMETRGGRLFCVVEVTDDGPGIRDRSGEGYSAPLEETARAQGKGFGLFITREVMQGHGGMLEVRSGEEVGTTVRLCFPQESRKEAR
jgi:two-component system nitrogen regulation sensor histidine kinase GlnL